MYQRTYCIQSKCDLDNDNSNNNKTNKGSIGQTYKWFHMKQSTQLMENHTYRYIIHIQITVSHEFSQFLRKKKLKTFLIMSNMMKTWKQNNNEIRRDHRMWIYVHYYIVEMSRKTGFCGHFPLCLFFSHTHIQPTYTCKNLCIHSNMAY